MKSLTAIAFITFLVLPAIASADEWWILNFGNNRKCHPAGHTLTDFVLRVQESGDDVEVIKTGLPDVFLVEIRKNGQITGMTTFAKSMEACLEVQPHWIEVTQSADKEFDRKKSL